MYAIVRDRGRQYKMREGDVVRVDLINEPPGSEVVFDDILLVSTPDGVEAGTPKVEGASVVATVLAEDKGPKLKLLKTRRVNRSRTRSGHRQHYTLVKVKEIRSPSGGDAVPET